MKAVARFKSVIWCMAMAYVDMLARDKNCVKCLLVRQYLFDKTVDAKGMKTNGSKETVLAILTMITKKLTQESLGRQGNRICWRV